MKILQFFSFLSVNSLWPTDVDMGFGQHWLRQLLVTILAPSHRLNQYLPTTLIADLMQVRVLELESGLEKERVKLAELRKKHYALAGESEGWEVDNEVGQDTQLRTWISNHIHFKLWDVITPPYLNFIGSLAKPPLKWGHGFTPHSPWAPYHPGARELTRNNLFL